MQDAQIWTDDVSGNVVRLNPAVGSNGAEVIAALRQFGLEECEVFQTSGSTGPAKFVCLRYAAMRASAKAVNSILNTSAADTWLRALPDWHVGGRGLDLRAELNGASVVLMGECWDPVCYSELCSDATLSALVPTQVFDLVKANCRAPGALRVVLVGGGRLRPEIRQAALALGWPIRETYGMSEAASQVATETDQGGMELLPIWDARVDREARLYIRGAALFSGYLVSNAGWTFDTPFDTGGWFRTGDRVQIERRKLEFPSN